MFESLIKHRNQNLLHRNIFIIQNENLEKFPINNSEINVCPIFFNSENTPAKS